MGEHIEKTKGKFKQAVGGLTGDKKLVHEGKRDEFKGRIEGAINDVKHGAKELKK